MYHIAPASGS